jgi:hypothetical protein
MLDKPLCWRTIRGFESLARAAKQNLRLPAFSIHRDHDVALVPLLALTVIEGILAQRAAAAIWVNALKSYREAMPIPAHGTPGNPDGRPTTGSATCSMRKGILGRR